mgnify:CR=1 FL=1
MYIPEEKKLGVFWYPPSDELKALEARARLDWFIAKHRLVEVFTLEESCIVYFSMQADLLSLKRLMEDQLSLRNLSNQRFIFDCHGVNLEISPVRSAFLGLWLSLKGYKFTVLSFRRLLINCLQLSDAIVVSSCRGLKSLEVINPNILKVSSIVASDEGAEKLGKVVDDNKIIFERFRGVNFKLRGNIRREKSFNSRKIHFYDGENYISSDKNRIYVFNDGVDTSIKIPGRVLGRFAILRPLERLFRSDQYNVLVIDGLVEFIVIRDKKIFLIDSTKKTCKLIGDLPGCRGIMHRAHCKLPDGRVIFGEYGHIPSKGHVPVYIIHPNEYRIEESNCLASIKAKHIHAIRWDEFSNSIWVCTGDEDGECHVIKLSKNLEIVDCLGDGTQTYRTCDFIFTPEEVIWMMDSPLAISRVVTLTRSSGNIVLTACLPGPAWYVVDRLDNLYLMSLVVEPGDAVTTLGAQVLISSDGKVWERLLYLEKDTWPSIFKYGVCEIGSDSDSHFYVNYQATVFNDGNSDCFRISK